MDQRKLQIKLSAALTAIAAGVAGGAPASAEILTVQLKNVRSSKGAIQLDLYTPDRKRVGKKRVAARPGNSLVQFDEIPPGVYGVYVYHDENANGKLDTGGLLKLPIEGYAFSNDAKATFGPPSIKDLSVTLPKGGSATTNATMHYRTGR
jgi:uncharacterized protein (DUF2141 family)